MSIETQTHVGCLVLNLSCGSRAKGLQSEVERYLKNNGEEWTCKRLKAYWNVALHLRNGDRESAIDVMQSNSISYSKKTCLPKGNWKFPINNFVIAQKPSTIRRYASALRFYCSLSLKEATIAQIRKAEKTISEGPKVFGMDGHSYRKKMKDELDHIFIYSINSRTENLSVLPEINMDEIYADRLKPNSYYFSDRPLPKRLKGEPYGHMALSIMTNSYVPSSIDKRTPEYEVRQKMKTLGFNQETIGRVNILQEQGCKGRVVAQPSLWVQLSFMPLHHGLNSYVRKIFPKESCLHDQIKGAYAIQDHIVKGNDCFSVDLSAATDRFPREYSLKLLDLLGLKDYSQALEDVCNRKFQKSFGDRGYISYNTGQPMGLYGSFPLFHLTNAFLAESSVMMTPERSISFSDGTYFKVLGDDIVFSDESISETYKKHLKILGVEVSVHKSFSGRVAEFAGFIAVPTRNSVCVFRPYKVPDGNVITNPLEFLHGLGHKVTKISKYWKKQILSYSDTLGKRDLALSPLIPTDKGVVSSIYRGDNQRIYSLMQYIKSTPEGIDLPMTLLEPLSNKPLFHERRMFDWYGYNKAYLINQEKDRKEEFRTIPKRLSRDPLFKQHRIDRKKLQQESIVSPVVPSQPITSTVYTNESRQNARSRQILIRR